MTRSLTQILGTTLLLASCALACGKYGPPVRSAASPASTPAAAPASTDAECEDGEKQAP